jgi:hypothetical protein
MPRLDFPRAAIFLHHALADGSLDRLPDMLRLPGDLHDYREWTRFVGLCRTYLKHSDYSETARDGVVRLPGLIGAMVPGTAA